MKFTPDIKCKLEQLINRLCLLTSLNQDDRVFSLVENNVYTIISYKTEQIKPFFGKPYTALTEIICLFPDDVGTGFVSVMNKNLEYKFQRILQDRKNYLKVKESLTKFNIEIFKIKKDEAKEATV